MKLINQFTLWFLAIVVPVLLLGGVIVFFVVQSEIENEARRRLTAWMENGARQLENGVQPGELNGASLEIRELPFSQSIQPLTISDTMAEFAPRSGVLDRLYSVAASYKIGNKHYLVTAKDFVAEPDEIAEGIIKSLILVFLLLLLLLGIGSRFMSKKLLSPFYYTLDSLKNFSLKQKQAIHLPGSRTTEFDTLNRFLERMTGKAVEDYRTLKEFGENASHELQTPLAIIRGKMELLLEKPVSQEQANHLNTALEEIEKMSKTNAALILLTKLENKEFDVPEQIDLSTLLKEKIQGFGELAEMKSINLISQIEPGVLIPLHPVLADILLNNLLSNAIRHNQENGRIWVSLKGKRLSIHNTGLPPQLPTEELFQRFRKNNAGAESVGLGLAIVKQICELNQFKVEYFYEDGIHKIEISF